MQAETEHYIEYLNALADLAQARRELAAVDETLDEFYCPVRGIGGENGSFYLDHGVHLMRAELERLRSRWLGCWGEVKSG